MELERLVFRFAGAGSALREQVLVGNYTAALSVVKKLRETEPGRYELARIERLIRIYATHEGLPTRVVEADRSSQFALAVHLLHGIETPAAQARRALGVPYGPTPEHHRRDVAVGWRKLRGMPLYEELNGRYEDIFKALGRRCPQLRGGLRYALLNERLIWRAYNRVLPATDEVNFKPSSIEPGS